MNQFIQDNISAIFALIGTFVGAALTFYGMWVLQRTEAKTRLLEKMLDKRIAAHEQVIQLAQSMRLMVSLGRFDKSGELMRTPNILTSKATFEDWIHTFSQTCASTTTWLSIEVVRELNLVQDYVLTLYENLRSVNADCYPEIGAVIRQDFIDFSQKLELLAHQYFTNDLTKFRMNDIRAWHKYKPGETQNRLSETAFMSKIDEINSVVTGSNK